MNFEEIYKLNERLIDDDEAEAFGSLESGLGYDLYNQLTSLLEEAQDRGCSDELLIQMVRDACGNVGIDI